MLVIISVSCEEIRTKYNTKERNLTCLGNWEKLGSRVRAFPVSLDK